MRRASHIWVALPFIVERLRFKDMDYLKYRYLAKLTAELKSKDLKHFVIYKQQPSLKTYAT
jgi:hypothetical protein